MIRVSWETHANLTAPFILQMQCLPLYSILMALGNPKVDYLSLDIEGAEEAVLKTIPWDKVDISIIGLEIIIEKHDEDASGTHVNSFPAIHDLLQSKGYVLIRTDWHTMEKKSLEAYFVKRELAKTIDKKYFKTVEMDESKKFIEADWLKPQFASTILA